MTFHWVVAPLLVKPMFLLLELYLWSTCPSIKVVGGNSCTLVLWAGPCGNLFICQLEDLIPVIKLPQRIALHQTLPQPGGDWRVPFSGSLSAKVIIVVLLFAKPSEHKVFSFTCVTLIMRDAGFFGSWIVYMHILFLISVLCSLVSHRNLPLIDLNTFNTVRHKLVLYHILIFSSNSFLQFTCYVYFLCGSTPMGNFFSHFSDVSSHNVNDYPLFHVYILSRLTPS